MNQSEWKEKFLTKLISYQSLILNNCNNGSLPKYQINAQSFFTDYQRILLNDLNSINSNIFLSKIDYSEFRLVTLISCLNIAKEKNSNHLNQNNPHSQCSSQFIRVNEIIKQSFELTSLIYILEWLHNIFQKVKAPINAKLEYSNLQKEFHPDFLNLPEKNDEQNQQQYEHLISYIYSLIRRGEYPKAQEIAESQHIFFLSSILEGGLAQMDFSIDTEIINSKIDFDLFPPFMKNKEFKAIQNAFKNKEKLCEVYGNQNWALWLSSWFGASEMNNNKSSLQINKLSCFLTGSSSSNQNYQETIDDILYKNILLLFNSILLKEYCKDNTILDYHYSTCGNIQKIIESNQNKTITDVLSYIRNTEGFKELTLLDYSLELEFDLIEMHFIDDTMTYSQLLRTFISKISTVYIQNDTLNQILENNYQELSRSRNNFNSESNVARKQDNIVIMKANYFKMLFVLLISFLETNKNKIDDIKTNSEMINTMNTIYCCYDDILYAYCNILLQISFDPIFIVFTTSFFFNLSKSKDILVKLAGYLKNQQDYQQFVNEIEKHFSLNREEMSTFLANKTSIFSFSSSIKNIDMVLEEKVMNLFNQSKYCISEEDMNKINQLKMLLTEGKINKEILIKYILLLAFNFLAVNKINEVFYIIHDSFSSNFKSEIEKTTIDDYLRKLTPDCNQINIQNMVIASCLRLVYQIVYCFNLYADVIYQTKKAISNSQSLFKNENKIDKNVVSSLNSLNYLIKLIVTNKSMTNFLIEFFGESVYNEVFKTVINNWIYQSIKWMSEIRTNDLFLQKRTNEGISNNLYEIHNLNMFDDMIMLDYFILKKQLDIFQKEEIFYHFLSQENKVNFFKILYKSIKQNDACLKELFDQKTNDILNEDLNRLDF